MEKVFRFKRFEVEFSKSAQRVTTDSVLLGAWVKLTGEERNILDVGAGTGLLALMMGQRVACAEIDALEIDELSYSESLINFKNSIWHRRIHGIKADFNDFNPQKKYSLIISNPPYFSERTFSQNDRRNLARHDTNLTIDTLIYRGKDMLEDGGSISFVCPGRIADRVRFVSEVAGFKAIRECEVVTVEGKTPTLSLFQLWHKGESVRERLCLRDRTGENTGEYKKLTEEFYLFLH